MKNTVLRAKVLASREMLKCMQKSKRVVVPRASPAEIRNRQVLNDIWGLHQDGGASNSWSQDEKLESLPTK